MRTRNLNIKLLLSVLLLSSGALVQAGNLASDGLRLVLDNGWVVPVSADGRALTGTATKLELPKASTGIYKVIEDRSFDRLYVVPQSDYAARGAVVFEWSSLRRIGFLPGVSEVIVPLDPAEKAIVTRMYRTSRADESGWNARIEWLVQGGADSSWIQSRDRTRPLRMIHQRELADTDHDWTLFQCPIQNGGGYRTRVPYLTLSRELIEQLDPQASEIDARRRAMQDGAIVDCWRNGDLLKAVLHDVGNGLSISRIRVGRKTAERINEVSAWMKAQDQGDEGPAAFIAAGDSGRYALTFQHDGSALLADWTDTSIQTFSAPDPDPEVFIRQSGQSSDGADHYFARNRYRYRSAVSPTYIEGGADRLLDDHVYRFSILPTPRWTKLELPDALTAPKQRAEAVAQIHAREDLDEAQRAEAVAALPLLEELSRQLGVVDIVYVLSR